MVNVFTEIVGDKTDAHDTFGRLFDDAIRLARPTLHAAGDVLLHHFGRHARVERDNLHGAFLVLRQDVNRHARDYHPAHHPHNQRENHYDKWVFKGYFDHNF
ncbi:MAG: hypothetical protein BRD50_02685 [Bacteroidetes bacterium SW_11_45_7]|nr:MAG: hypothetical protein BRD50_02685 [Bacteroidetes bacterium SW_11_45_7]